MASDMERAAPQFYCSKVQTADGATWFAGVELTLNLNNPSDLIDATFNLTLTDGQSAWTGQGKSFKLDSLQQLDQNPQE